MEQKLCLCVRVDPDSSLYSDMQVMREKEGVDHILFNFTFKVHSSLLYFTVEHILIHIHRPTQPPNLS